MDVLTETPEPIEDTATDVAAEVRFMLKVADRCDDACGAQAMLAVQVTPDAGPLLFCKHDFEKHELALVAAGAVILIDNRHTLTARPSNANAV